MRDLDENMDLVDNVHKKLNYLFISFVFLIEM